MKNAIIILLLSATSLSAQVTTLEKDTIYKDGKAYGLLIKTGKMANAVYSVKTLTNVELAVVKYDAATEQPVGSNGFFRFTFLGTGAFGHFHPGLNVPKSIAAMVVENDLINNNAINPEGEKRFLALNPSQIKNQPSVVINVNTSNTDYTTAERNRSTMIFDSNGTLSQSSVTIGTYTSSVDHSGGKSTSTIKYFLPTGVQCATATCDNTGAKTATVITMKDNRTHLVNITNSAVKEKEIAKYLADNFYL